MRYKFSRDDSRHFFYHAVAQTSQIADYGILHVPYGQIQCHLEVAIIFCSGPWKFYPYSHCNEKHFQRWMLTKTVTQQRVAVFEGDLHLVLVQRRLTAMTQLGQKWVIRWYTFTWCRYQWWCDLWCFQCWYSEHLGDSQNLIVQLKHSYQLICFIVLWIRKCLVLCGSLVEIKVNIVWIWLKNLCSKVLAIFTSDHNYCNPRPTALMHDLMYK